MATAQTRTTPTFPITRLDLVEEVREMRASPISNGHVAKTVLRNGDLRMVLIVLQRGAQIARHHAKGSAVIQAIDGRVVASLLESSFDLTSGSVLTIDPEITHSLVAIEDSALLLTIAHAREKTTAPAERGPAGA